MLNYVLGKNPSAWITLGNYFVIALNDSIEKCGTEGLLWGRYTTYCTDIPFDLAREEGKDKLAFGLWLKAEVRESSPHWKAFYNPSETDQTQKIIPETPPTLLQPPTLLPPLAAKIKKLPKQLFKGNPLLRQSILRILLMLCIIRGRPLQLL